MVDPKGYLQSDFVIQTGVKLAGSQMEKSFSKMLKKLPSGITIDSFKDLENDPLLNLTYEVLKNQSSIKTIESIEKMTDDDFKRPVIFDFEFDYFYKFATSAIH